MDDDYGADDALLAAMDAADTSQPSRRTFQQPAPQKIQQPTPQRLDKAPPARSSAGGPKVVQPTPQALPQKQQGGSTILVSPRQRGNPVIAAIRSMPWEYSDVPADYVMGLTTCALFLSLKYHRLHPEYIYTRIRNLQGKYNLRILLTLVDIPNHEDSLRELSKTSLVNNVTIILCWSAAEAARYLELYKSYEGASFGAIRGQQPSTYGDKLVEFVTVPRSLNKSDAVALVANFGSLRNAINADAEQLGSLSGWGGIKVKRWTEAVEEPFRSRKAAKRTAGDSGDNENSSSRTSKLDQAKPLSRVPLRDMPATPSITREASSANQEKQFRFLDDDDENDDEEAMMAAAIEESKRMSQAESAKQSQSASAPGATSKPDASQSSRPGGESPSKRGDDPLSSGIAAALAKLRDNGG